MAQRTLPCDDPYCMCAGEGHPCVGSCKSADSCTCWCCELCDTRWDEENITVDEDGNPIGVPCCGHLLDENGKVNLRADTDA